MPASKAAKPAGNIRITRINAYQVDLPVAEGRYSWSNDNFVETFDSTIIEIETDAGIKGYGECCPLGPSYLPAYAAGVRAGLNEIGPKLIGLDPTHLSVLNHKMDASLRGHAYVKAPIDVACWDILGKAAGLPAYVLMGGAEQKDVELYRAISQDSPDAMAAKVKDYRSQGYKKFQLKVGGNADEDIERIRACRKAVKSPDVIDCDSNTGWTLHEACRVVNAVRDLDVYIEQPCPTYEQCLTVRRQTSLPFVLDENIDGLGMLQRAIADGAMDMINLKISKVGGLTKARQIRDFAMANGLAMIIEDTHGGDMVTAAIAHLAQSTPEEFLFAATDFNSYVSKDIAKGAPKRSKDGRMQAPDRPGLGFEPIMEALGKPVISIGK